MHKKKHIWCIVMMVLIVAFDQITKYVAMAALEGGKIVAFIPKVIQFNFAKNTGMAFSLLSGARWLFVLLTAVVCVGVIWYMFSNRCKSLWLYWSLGVVISGGVGNLIDRTINGYVIDFLEPIFVDFAIFNIADCAVTCGAVSLIACLVVDLFKGEKKNEQ